MVHTKWQTRYSVQLHFTSYFALGFHRLLWYYGQNRLEFQFFMSYQVKFKAAICGQHVYKATWSPVMNEVLICKKDNREEAQEYDSNAVGVYKDIAERDNLELAGHVPVELSRVLAGFLASKESNSLAVQVCGK